MRRLRTRLQLAILLAAHAIAVRVARLALRLLRRTRPEDSAGAPRGKVSILLMHAWGMGGTIRTTLNVAGYLATHHDVEVISVVRRRDVPFFEFPPGVTVTALDDQRVQESSRFARVLAGLPSVLLYPGDRRASKPCRLRTDLLLLRWLWADQHGTLIGTRPALNLLALRTAAPDTAVIGIEHVNYRSHSRPQRSAISKRYPRLSALVVLTRRDLEEYRRVLPGVRIVQISNPISRSRATCAPASRNPSPSQADGLSRRRASTA